jgi:hypothetical protein
MRGDCDGDEESDFAAYFLADDSDDPDDTLKDENDHTTHNSQDIVSPARD